MKKSDSIKEIATALCECQKEIQDVYKASQGYGYKYASLDKVYDEIRPKATKHGLSYTHQKSFNRDLQCIELNTLLMHTSGEWIEYYGSLPFSSMKQMNDYQASGSGFTYLERYQTSAIFGITSDEDNDAQGEQEPKKEPSITNEQAEEIMNLIDKTNSDYDALLKFAKCNDITEMKADVYPKIKAMLEKKLLKE